MVATPNIKRNRTKLYRRQELVAIISRRVGTIFVVTLVGFCLEELDSIMLPALPRWSGTLFFYTPLK